MPILEPAEHGLHAVAPFVSPLIAFDRCPVFLLSGGAGAYPFVLQRFSEPVRIISAIPERPIDLRQAAEQRLGADIVTYLPGSDKQGYRSPIRIVLGSMADNGSFITVVASPCFATGPTIIRANMPFSLQRFQQL